MHPFVSAPPSAHLTHRTHRQPLPPVPEPTRASWGDPEPDAPVWVAGSLLGLMYSHALAARPDLDPKGRDELHRQYQAAARAIAPDYAAWLDAELTRLEVAIWPSPDRRRLALEAGRIAAGLPS
jgi:hypothetical protein